MRPAGQANSPNFGAISENLSVSQLNLEDEVDWYRFETNDWGTSHDFAQIQFVDDDGDLQLELYDSDGITRLRSSTSFNDNEFVSLAGFEPGTFYVRVFGRNDDQNPSYTLVIDPPGNSPDDLVEPNDGVVEVESRAEGGDSPNLGTIIGQLQLDELRLEDQVDWYRFSTTDWGTSRHHVSIDFIDDNGDLTLELYAADGTTRLKSSNSFSDNESVSLAGLEPNVYFVKVSGRNGDANDNYTLRVLAPGTIADDVLEPNDSPSVVAGYPVSSAGATANFGLLEVTTEIGNLKLEDQVDWYRFETSDWGTSHDYALIRFQDDNGDLQLELYASDGESRLRSSSSFSDNESVSLAELEPGEYFLRVTGRNGDANDDYSLAIDPPGNSADDRFEPNDSFQTVLRAIPGAANSPYLAPDGDGQILLSGLRLEDQVDYYAFSLPNFGTAEDEILLEFVDDVGDLNLYLYDNDGDLRRSSTRFSDNEVIDLEGYAPGVYVLGVFGRSGDANSEYQLRVDLPDSPPVIADLVSRDLDVTGNTSNWLQPGQTFTARWSLQESGGVAANGIEYSFVLSADRMFDTGDTVLSSDTVNLAANESTGGTVSLSLASSTPEGSYHLLLVSDPQNAINESDKLNNTFATPVFVFGSQPATATVSGTIFTDRGGDSVKESDAAGFAGVTVLADYNFNGRIDDGEPNTVSDDLGAYQLTDVRSGSTAIVAILPGNHVQSLPAPAPRPVQVDRLRLFANGDRDSLVGVSLAGDLNHPFSSNVGSLSRAYGDVAFDPSGRLLGLDGSSLWVESLSGGRSLLGRLPSGFANAVALGAGPDFALAAVSGSKAVLIDSQTLEQRAEIDLQGITIDGDVTYHAGAWFMTSGGDELVRLDFESATAAVIGPLGISNAYGLVSGPDGRLYATTEQELMVIDTQTGAATFAENLAFSKSEQANGLASWREAMQWTAGHSQLGSGGYLVSVGVADDIANVDFGFVPQAEIVGRVFDDANENGQIDPGDFGIDGFWVFVDLNRDGDADSGEPRVRSSADGSFRLPPLAVGQYQLRLVDEPGRRITSTSDGVAVVDIDGEQDVVTVLVGVAVDAPPRVAAVDPAPGSEIVQAVTSIELSFTGPMDPATVWSGTFVLVEQGADQRFDTADDQRITIRAATLAADPQHVSLDFHSPLPRGSYRLTIRDFMVDQYGNAFDGEFAQSLPSGDGLAGGAFRYGFQVVNSVPTIPPLRQTVQQGVRAGLDLEVEDADGDAVTIDVEEPPTHGVAEVVDNQIFYTADSDYQGSDELIVRAVDDRGAAVTETVQLSVLRSPGDLVTDAIAIGSPLGLVLGLTSTVSWRVSNLGPGDATYRWSDELYYSVDATLDDSDTRLARISSGGGLEAGQAIWQTAAVQLPDGVQQGFLIVNTDASNRVAELNTANNVFATAFEPTPGVVIVPESVPFMVAANSEFDIQWLDIPAGENSEVSFFLDADRDAATDADAVLLRDALPATADGTVDSTRLQIPAVTPGDYAIYARLDGDGQSYLSRVLPITIVDRVLGSDEVVGDAVGGSGYEVHGVDAGRVGDLLRFRIRTNYNPLSSGAGDVYLNLGGSYRTGSGSVLGLVLQDRQSRSGQSLVAGTVYGDAEFRRGTVRREHPSYIDSYGESFPAAASVRVDSVVGVDWEYEIIGEVDLAELGVDDTTPVEVGWTMYCGNDFGSADDNQDKPDLLGEMLLGPGAKAKSRPLMATQSRSISRSPTRAKKQRVPVRQHWCFPQQRPAPPC